MGHNGAATGLNPEFRKIKEVFFEGRNQTMPKEPALRATHLDWDRELCKKGCKEWIPWYKDRKGKTVYSCRLGLIPERNITQWYCRHRKPEKRGLEPMIKP
ncbi:MAG: hypothetical protein HWN68_16940 [Desulfobacterales bacterium]|nr:hypothetical protein [Desulfobacterales bacterium]